MGLGGSLLDHQLLVVSSLIPKGARTVKMRTWGGGFGTFWRLGDTIGVEWERVPDWGPEATPGVCSRSWECKVAQQWIESLAKAAKTLGLGHAKEKEYSHTAPHGGQ